MKEWKMYNIENDRKWAPQKMIEKSHPENERIENARHEKGRKCKHLKMTENPTWKMKEQKMHDMENGS